MTPDYNDGNWHGWNGGECPVHPQSECDFIDPVADAQNDTPYVGSGPAIAHDWARDPVLFRVVKEYREPREWWLKVYNEGSGVDVPKIVHHGAAGAIRVREVLE